MSSFFHYTFQIPSPVRLFSFRPGDSPKNDKNKKHFISSSSCCWSNTRVPSFSFTKLNTIHFLRRFYSSPALLIRVILREHRKHAGPLHHPILSLRQQHTWTKINFMDSDLVCNALFFSLPPPQHSGHIMMTSSFKAKNPGKCTAIQLPMQSHEFCKCI